MRSWAMVACAVLLAAGCGPMAAAKQARLEVVADTSLQAFRNEVEYNSGASSVIRIKAYQHFMLAKFDLSPIRGWRVDAARLYLHLARPKHCLWRVGISTITSDWREGSGTGGAPAKGGCCFLRAIWPDKPWAGPESDFTYVAFGAGGSFMHYAKPRELAGGWLEIDVHPHLVAAMMVGGSFGLCISDEKGQTLFNNDVHSREQSRFRPYMIVEGQPLAGRPTGSGPAIVDLRAQPYPEAADFERGAVRLTFTAPQPLAISYRLRVSGPDGTVELPRWQLPSPAPPGTPREVIFRGRPNTEYRFTLIPLALPWQPEGKPATVVGRTSPALRRPAALPAPAAAAERPGELRRGGFTLAAYTGQVKLSPVTGRPMEDSARPLQSLNLHAARNEVISFQLAIGFARPFSGATVAISDLRGPGGATIPSSAARWFRQWPVKTKSGWWPDYAVPLSQPFSAPWPPGRVPGQRWELLWCDIYVPKSIPPGRYSGRVAFRCGSAALSLPISVTVHRFTMPDELGFEINLNCYGPVYSDRDWEKYLRVEGLYFNAAHEHRCTLQPLPYSQSGRVYRGWVPELAGSGAQVRIADWSQYDRHWGPYLDGSAFTGYRAGVPISNIYLPLHENWPLPIAEHYHVKVAEKRYPQMLFEHARIAPPIEQAFDDQFKQGWQRVAVQFAEHARQRGWTKTNFQCYLNNKHYWKDPKRGGRGTSWWCLDEPMCTDDFLALRFFARLFQPAKKAARPARFIFRGDISRPQWQRDFLDGLADLEVVSSALFRYGPRLWDMQRRWGVRFWHYSTANPASQTNYNAVAWALRAYLAGADGIVPWNSIGGDGALDTPTPTALLVPADRFRMEGPVVSLRVKAFRSGQQLVELLRAVSARRGWNRTQAAEAVAALLKLRGRTVFRYAADAGTITFENLSPESFRRLRLSLLRALD